MVILKFHFRTHCFQEFKSCFLQMKNYLIDTHAHLDFPELYDRLDEVLKKVEFVGNDLKMDPGIGTCGKNGQGVPVGVGQPTLKINGLTVGGTVSS